MERKHILRTIQFYLCSNYTCKDPAGCAERLLSEYETEIKTRAIKEFTDYKYEFEELNKLMEDYFEMWDTRKELTELEKLGLRIVTIGTQNLGAFISKIEENTENV